MPPPASMNLSTSPTTNGALGSAPDDRRKQRRIAPSDENDLAKRASWPSGTPLRTWIARPWACRPSSALKASPSLSPPGRHRRSGSQLQCPPFDVFGEGLDVGSLDPRFGGVARIGQRGARQTCGHQGSCAHDEERASDAIHHPALTNATRHAHRRRVRSGSRACRGANLELWCRSSSRFWPTSDSSRPCGPATHNGHRASCRRECHRDADVKHGAARGRARFPARFIDDLRRADSAADPTYRWASRGDRIALHLGRHALVRPAALQPPPVAHPPIRGKLDAACAEPPALLI